MNYVCILNLISEQMTKSAEVKGARPRPCLVQLLSTDSAAAQQNLNQRANPAESDSRNPLPKSEPKAEAAQDVLSKI